MLEVTWSEGTSTIIYRRYSDFFEFQVRRFVFTCHTHTLLARRSDGCCMIAGVCVCVCVAVWLVREISRRGWVQGSICPHHSFLARYTVTVYSLLWVSVCVIGTVCVCVCVRVRVHVHVHCVGKKLLGRSQVRSVAEKRRDQLNDYCRVNAFSSSPPGQRSTIVTSITSPHQALVRLPPKISDDEFVHNFFELRLEDLHDPRYCILVCV